jgi:hypothetical protein
MTAWTKVWCAVRGAAKGRYNGFQLTEGDPSQRRIFM